MLILKLENKNHFKTLQTIIIMIIQEHQLIQMFEPQENNKTAIYAFWVLHKAIIPHINNESLTAFPGRKLIAKVCKLSLSTVDKCLEYLEGQKIIKIKKRYDEKTKIHKSNIYSIETDLLKTVGKLKSREVEEEMPEPSQPSKQGVVNPVNKGSLSSRQGVVYPVDTNLQEEINLQVELTNIKKENPKPQKFDAEKYLESLELDSEIKQNLKSWLEIRKTKKTPTTQNAIDLQIKHLGKFSKEVQIQMIQNSVMGGWAGIFDLKPNYQNTNFNQNNTQFRQKLGNLTDEQAKEKYAGFYTEAKESVLLPSDPIEMYQHN